jgi:dihydrofolate reductase
MGTITANFFISLDGVVEQPQNWHFPYFNDEMGAAINRGFETTDAMLMGRVLYEEWAAFWPTSTDEPVATIFNEATKYVVSNTLTEATWNNTTIINGDVVRGVRDLRDSVTRDITVTGSTTLVRWLLAEGLLDRLNLMIHPIVVGKGQRLWDDGPNVPLALVSQETFSTGVLNASYAPAR